MKWFDQAEQAKKAAVITAEGDSKAAELISKALIEAGDGNIYFYFENNVIKNQN